MTAATHPTLRPLIITRALMRHWLLIFIIVYGAFNALPFLAPVLMKAGWSAGGNAIYTFYSTLCHQMAQRSFFLFGERIMYSPDQLPITLTGRAGTDTLLLRHFRGSDTLGWKVAWSDRMVSLYSGIWLAGVIYGIVSFFRPVKPISVWMFGLLALPMILDGGTHMISDSAAGITGGFRYNNEWLAALTAHTLPISFYSGDALGSFNSWMRLLTGGLFATGVVWFVFPLADRYAHATVRDINGKMEQVTDLQHRLSAGLDQAHDQIKHQASRTK